MKPNHRFILFYFIAFVLLMVAVSKLSPNGASLETRSGVFYFTGIYVLASTIVWLLINLLVMHLVYRGLIIAVRFVLGLFCFNYMIALAGGPSTLDVLLTPGSHNVNYQTIFSILGAYVLCFAVATLLAPDEPVLPPPAFFADTDEFDEPFHS
nr:hypothetical protein [uncultured Mucilaginibacter sp.]